MTSRERVLRCLEFRTPDRVPRDIWALPLTNLVHGEAAMQAFYQRWPVDIGRPNWTHPATGQLTKGDMYGIGEYTDDWGCTFENIQQGVIGEVKHPRLEDWAKLSDLKAPTAWLNIDVDAINRACAASDKFLFAHPCPRPFERIQFLRGTENVLMDLMSDSSELKDLIKLVHDFYCKEMEVWAKTKIDALPFMDDWGTQRALIISPALWRKVFKPLYKDYADIAHAHGKKIFMHSDGYIFDIYQDLIDIGIDAINSQLFCMNIEEIGRRYKGRITFWGEIDRQHLLAYATLDEVRAGVKRVVDHLWSSEGGVFAQFEFGLKMENADEVFRSWEHYTHPAQ